MKPINYLQTNFVIQLYVPTRRQYRIEAKFSLILTLWFSYSNNMKEDYVSTKNNPTYIHSVLKKVLFSLKQKLEYY